MAFAPRSAIPDAARVAATVNRAGVCQMVAGTSAQPDTKQGVTSPGKVSTMWSMGSDVADGKKKRCSRCKETKLRSHFGPNAKAKDGVQGYCKPCNREQAKIKGWAKQGIKIDVKGYAKLVDEQGGRCAICRRERSPSRSLEVDHDHTTMKVRALLCLDCNTGLGKFKDSTALLKEAVKYLEQHAGANDEVAPEPTSLLVTLDDVACDLALPLSSHASGPPAPR
jgi:hypothetical protein